MSSYSHKMDHGSVSIPLQQVTSLRRRAQAKTPMLCRIGYVMSGAKTSPLCEGCRGQSLQCTIDLIVFSEINHASRPHCAFHSAFYLSKCFPTLLYRFPAATVTRNAILRSRGHGYGAKERFLLQVLYMLYNNLTQLYSTAM